MPFDGIVTKNIVNELSEILVSGRIEKIFQPERDEIIINIRASGNNYKLLCSANPGFPRVHFTQEVKENPKAPPVFCMLLRKHLSSGRIIDISSPGYERIITISVESVNELGDMSIKKLIIEIMGRHSNIILINSDDRIIDSIKHVDNEISSVREIMPARLYMLPPEQNKADPGDLDMEMLFSSFALSDLTGEKYLLSNIKGFSPLICREICFRADIETKKKGFEFNSSEIKRLRLELENIIGQVLENKFSPCIIYKDTSLQNPVDFYCLKLVQYSSIKYLDSLSLALDEFYSEKDKFERLKQKKSDILKILTNSIDRCKKKIFIQQETLRQVSDRENLRLYGELITANIYCIPKGVKKVPLQNYYSENNQCIDVPLDENFSPQENAQRYFKRYSKAKNTFTHTSVQVRESQKELDYLESVLHLLDNCTNLQEIDEIRQELIEQGYAVSKKKTSKKNQAKASAPMHFVSSDGLDIYVGKNNKQNDQLTLKSASSNDIWLHTKNIHGSHVIIRKQLGEIPQKTLFEGAALAAYYSKARMSSNVEVDYTRVKNVKKPSGAKPGMVIYENYKTIVVTPDSNIVKELSAKRS